MGALYLLITATVAAIIILLAGGFVLFHRNKLRTRATMALWAAITIMPALLSWAALLQSVTAAD